VAKPVAKLQDVFYPLTPILLHWEKPCWFSFGNKSHLFFLGAARSALCLQVPSYPVPIIPQLGCISFYMVGDSTTSLDSPFQCLTILSETTSLSETTLSEKEMGSVKELAEAE